MKVLIVQLVPPSHAPDRPRFSHALGVAVAAMKRAGLDVALTAMAEYDPRRLRSAINHHRPSHMVADLPPTRATAARHTVVDVAEKHFLPVVLVGRYPTCQSEEAISIPGVAAIIRGEYDRALPRLLTAMAGQTSSAGDVPGVWLNSAEGLRRNDPDPPAPDLDALGHPDREIFDYARTVEADREVAFAASRGCRNWCAHCLNDWYLTLCGNDCWLRRRSVSDLLDEVAAVTQRYPGGETVAFDDHAFATDVQWLEEFAEAYSRRCPLPYRCHVCLNALDPRTPEMLAGSGCRMADVEIGSGSNFIRQDVLTMRTTGRQIIDGAAALKNAGIKVRGSVFVGMPYESEVSVEETLDLLVRLKLDAVRPRVFFPIPGTRAMDICAENGWISGRGERGYYDRH
ncbi:hypothetical protein LCGC14_2555230, partial [marine sediment metagenome]